MNKIDRMIEQYLGEGAESEYHKVLTKHGYHRSESMSTSINPTYIRVAKKESKHDKYPKHDVRLIPDGTARHTPNHGAAQDIKSPEDLDKYLKKFHSNER